MQSERRIVIVGAARGIGAAGARAFTNAGWRVALVDVAGDPIRELAESIDSFWTTVDVRCPAHLSAALEASVAALGGLDAAWSNVGVQVAGSVLKTRVEDLDHCWALNVRSHFVCAQTVFPTLRAGGGGSFIITASNIGLGASSALAHAPTTAAAIALARCLARDYARDGIRVNVLCRGFVDTPPVWENRGGSEALVAPVADSIPLGRSATPEEVAEQALFLLSDAAQLVTGQVLAVDRGRLG